MVWVPTDCREGRTGANPSDGAGLRPTLPFWPVLMCTHFPQPFLPHSCGPYGCELRRASLVFFVCSPQAPSAVLGRPLD